MMPDPFFLNVRTFNKHTRGLVKESNNLVQHLAKTIIINQRKFIKGEEIIIIQ